jgi:hypothetical protein
LDKIGGTAPPPQPPPAPDNDNFAAAALLSGETGTVSGTNAGATGESGEPDHASSTSTGRRSVWYNWTANATGQTNFNTSGSNYDTVLGIYIGNNVGALTLIGSNDDVQPGVIQHSTVSFSAVAGTTYRIAVDGFELDTGNFVLNWSGSASTPTPTPTPTPAASVFQFSHSSYSVVEHDGSVGVVIVRTGDVSTQQTIHFNAQPIGSILPGPGTNQDITFAPGETYKITAGLGINNDVEPDPTLTATLTLTPVSPGTTIGAQGTATLTIFDDDSFPPNSVKFVGPPLNTVNEGAGKIELTVTRTALSGGNLSGDAWVSYRTFNSSAVDNEDYSLAGGTLHFLPGESSKTITILITDDAFDEPDETFNIQLLKPLQTSVFILETTIVTVQIQDNDPPAQQRTRPTSRHHL